MSRRTSTVTKPAGARRDSLARIGTDVVACELCPRLRRYCEEVAASKLRAYADWKYWGKPVPGFGDPGARLWVLGLAPAAHGGNRTGRVFTGDSSGEWLFRALHAHGFARLPVSNSSADGQELYDTYISAAARCAPPDNKPLPIELARCSRYMDRELEVLTSLRLIVPLGRIAFDAALRLLDRRGYEIPRPRPQFAHGARYKLQSESRAPIELLASYHPSRQNTQTGKLTIAMLDDIFATARRLLPPTHE
jgi:uracil-DNA glycosylase family 4